MFSDHVFVLLLMSMVSSLYKGLLNEGQVRGHVTKLKGFVAQTQWRPRRDKLVFSLAHTSPKINLEDQSVPDWGCGWEIYGDGRETLQSPQGKTAKRVGRAAADETVEQRTLSTRTGISPHFWTIGSLNLPTKHYRTEGCMRCLQLLAILHLKTTAPQVLLQNSLLLCEDRKWPNTWLYYFFSLPAGGGTSQRLLPHPVDLEAEE